MLHARNVFDVFDISNHDLAHHKMRVSDIINKKAVGDHVKQCKLAKIMADRITDVDKAYGRYLVSEEMDAPHLAKIFLNRFKELTYSLTDWRKEKILDFLKDEED